MNTAKRDHQTLNVELTLEELMILDAAFEVLAEHGSYMVLQLPGIKAAHSGLYSKFHRAYEVARGKDSRDE